METGCTVPSCRLGQRYSRFSIKIFRILPKKSGCGPKFVGFWRVWRQLILTYPFSRRLISQQSAHDESWALGDTGAERRQHLMEILAEGRRLFNDHSSILRSSIWMFHYDVREAWRDTLVARFDAIGERIVSVHSASTSQVEKYGETMSESDSSIVLYLVNRLSLSAATANRSRQLPPRSVQLSVFRSTCRLANWLWQTTVELVVSSFLFFV